jgi:ankyrin repeat protein
MPLLKLPPYLLTRSQKHSESLEAQATRLFRREKITKTANTSKVADRTKGSSTPSTRAPTSDNDEQTPLHLAVRDGKKGVVKALLKERIDKHAEDKDGKTAFYYAVFEGKEEIARLFAADEETKADLLLQAAGSGNAGAVNLLLGLGASPKVTGKDGSTPLYRAVFGGHVKAAKALKGCIEDRDRDDDTILLKAVKLGNQKATALLLELKPVVDAKDAKNKTALYNAVCRGDRSIAELLVKGHASTEALDENQDTLLHQAVREGQEAAVAILLDLHAEIKAKDSNGKTPLENSIKNGQKGITRILADKNADTRPNVGLCFPGSLLPHLPLVGSETVLSLHGHWKQLCAMALRPRNPGLPRFRRAERVPLVFNYSLPDECYSVSVRSYPMASQRSNVSTGGNYSNSSANPYELRDSSRPYAPARHTTSTQVTNQYPSYDPQHSRNHQRSEKDDR